MTNAILKYEILSDEQLDLVAGGSDAQTKVDIGFFMQLNYNMAKTGVRDAYGDNGINFVEHGDEDNGYYILSSGGNWERHPHWAAMGLVLARNKYPGFNGNWTDGKYVQSFLKEHFHIQSFG